MYKYKQILLIDDDIDDQDIFRDAVQELNADLICIIADNGLDGLSKTKLPPAPDLIFIDINMPVMNGFQYLEAIKKEPGYMHIPSIIFTTSDNHQDKVRAKELGAVKFITKPNNFNQLKKILEEVFTSDFS